MSEINGFDYTDVLLKASELVAEEGRWVQRAWFRSHGQDIDSKTAQIWDEAGEPVSVCALGAVTLAAHRLGVSDSVLKGARARLAWWLRKAGASMSGGVAGWNDASGRRADEVAQALRSAAEGEL